MISEALQVELDELGIVFPEDWLKLANDVNDWGGSRLDDKVDMEDLFIWKDYKTGSDRVDWRALVQGLSIGNRTRVTMAAGFGWRLLKWDRQLGSAPLGVFRLIPLRQLMNIPRVNRVQASFAKVIFESKPQALTMVKEMPSFELLEDFMRNLAGLQSLYGDGSVAFNAKSGKFERHLIVATETFNE